MDVDTATVDEAGQGLYEGSFYFGVCSDRFMKMSPRELKWETVSALVT